MSAEGASAGHGCEVHGQAPKAPSGAGCRQSQSITLRCMLPLVSDKREARDGFTLACACRAGRALARRSAHLRLKIGKSGVRVLVSRHALTLYNARHVKWQRGKRGRPVRNLFFPGGPSLPATGGRPRQPRGPRSTPLFPMFVTLLREGDYSGMAQPGGFLRGVWIHLQMVKEKW